MPFHSFGRRGTSSPDKRIDQLHQKVLELAGIYEARQKHQGGNGSSQERIAKTLKDLREALPAQGEARISALETKLSLLADLYDAWSRRNSDRAAIVGLEQRLGKLEPAADAEERKRDGANLAIFMTLTLVVGSIVSVVVYVTLLQRPAPDTWELISYLAPALAAVFAGLTAYVKRWETLFFWASSILVLSGVGAFYISKSIQPLMIWNWLIGYAFAATVFWLPYFFILRRRKPDTPFKKGLVITSAALLVMGVWFDFFHSHGNPPQAFTNLVNKAYCYFPGSAAGDGSVGRSAEKSDKKGDDYRSSCTHP